MMAGDDRGKFSAKADNDGVIKKVKANTTSDVNLEADHGGHLEDLSIGLARPAAPVSKPARTPKKPESAAWKWLNSRFGLAVVGIVGTVLVALVAIPVAVINSAAAQEFLGWKIEDPANKSPGTKP